ncbi:DEAD/DEAH box helicase [Stigmatella erecta]|uniref:DEAD/DEAH box helicase n=1 Tax=Stigmatella erecta TaxID=83460 RepID=UPI0011606DF7|nr:DEAD/DEAH box helicase [Stigmatella erecta]
MKKIALIDQSHVLRNLTAQLHAKYILKEVGELPERFPKFVTSLEERAQSLAYALLSSGCSLEETGSRGSGAEALTRAASLLQEAFFYSNSTTLDSRFQLLIAGMAFYSAGQYSRAFVTMREAVQPLLAGKIVRAFLQKDIPVLVRGINEALLSTDNLDGRIAEAIQAESLDEEWMTILATSLIARALNLHLESLYSGQGQSEEALGVLSNGMTCMSAEDSPGWWWIMRLLKLMIQDGASNSPYLLLGPYFEGETHAILERYCRSLAFLARPSFEIWASQRAALPLALSSEVRGGAISLRTSAGKTRVAEIAIVHALASDPQAKALYIAPFRSLAAEIESALSSTLEPLGFGVSQLYGGSVASKMDENILGQSRVVIATPEKIKSLLRFAPHIKDDIRIFIVDEGHLIGLNERLIRNEVFLEGLLARTKESKARILLLSAVLPNAEQIGAWIGETPKASVRSPWKPSGERFGLLLWNGKRVKLEWRGDEPSFNPAFVDAAPPRKKGRRKLFPADKREAVAATAVRLSNTGPVLIFTGMAKSVKGLAQAAIEAMGPGVNNHDWPLTEWQVFEAACAESLGPNSIELRAARVGVICHHAQLPSEVRFTIERLMRSRAPRIIVATTTLAQGVNVGVSSVIIANHFVDQRPMSNRDFWNICGRAGRAFVDIEGKILFALDETGKAWQVERDRKLADDYFQLSKIEPAVSGVLAMLRGLRSIAKKSGVDFAQLLEMAANNDFSVLSADAGFAEVCCDLLDDEILALIEENSSTPLEDFIDQTFGRSLAALQAAHEPQSLGVGDLLSFIKARAKATMQMAPSQARPAIISSALPFRAAVKLYGFQEQIKQVAAHFLESAGELKDLCTLVKQFEPLIHLLPSEFLQTVPATEHLELIRELWLGGSPLVEIAKLTSQAQPITARFYGHVLPWIMSGAAQQLRTAGDIALAEVLDKAAACVELGLPSDAAVRVFLAGVMARSAATEIALILSDYVVGLSGRILRAQLISPDVRKAASGKISPSSLHWLEILVLQDAALPKPPPPLPNLRITGVDKNVSLHLRSSSGGTVWIVDASYKVLLSPPRVAAAEWDRAANDPRLVYRWSEPDQCWKAFCRQPFFEAQY